MEPVFLNSGRERFAREVRAWQRRLFKSMKCIVFIVRNFITTALYTQ